MQTTHNANWPVPPSNTPVNGESKWLLGWTVGGGMEFALTDRWSAKAEYMYYDLGKETYHDRQQPARRRRHARQHGSHRRELPLRAEVLRGARSSRGSGRLSHETIRSPRAHACPGLFAFPGTREKLCFAQPTWRGGRPWMMQKGHEAVAKGGRTMAELRKPYCEAPLSGN